MCGIAGILRLDGGEVSAKTLDPMVDVLEHRGPDDTGIYTEGPVGFAHKRLSILDLSPLGRQPMSHNSLPVVVTFNGEIYNYLELRSELEGRGHQFKTSSDTEVLIASYIEWGVACFRRFNGMFALGIWDSRKSELIVARDRYGKKPFLYVHDSQRFMFASEIKSLEAGPDFSRTIDTNSILSFLEWRYIPDPHSIYSAVHKLPAGHYGTIDLSGQFVINCYYDPVQEHREASAEFQARTETEVLDELDTLLSRALEYRIRSDVPYGAFLSGGVDSSLTVAMLTKSLGISVKTFTIGYLDSPANEADIARKTAERLGTDHTELMVTSDDAKALVAELGKWYDEPFADESAIPTILVSRLARSQVTVALSGDGGDEFFAGYNYYRWCRNANRAQGVMPSGVARVALNLTGSLLGDRFAKTLGLLAQGTVSSRFAYLSNPFKDVAVDTVYRGSGNSKKTAYEEWFNRHPDLQDVDAMMLHDILHYLPGDILTKVDKASMSCSLEVRCPMLDPDLTRFALGLPLEWKWRNGVQKYALKQLLQRYLPAEVTNKPKTGFRIPLDDWFRDDLKDWAGERLLEAPWPDDLINRTAVEACWRDHVSGHRNHVSILWGLIVLGDWFQRHNT